jgi:4-amino-4-deoxy-L-arabinose transferase-like glycosyltransferase
MTTTTYPYVRPEASLGTTAPPRRGLVRRAVQGPVGQPRWVRPSVLGLLVGTALLYLWNLGASGNANEFYAAAVQAGTKSWEAMFFGSLDSSNFITVDKPPASLWPMEIAGRIFGFNSWSMLVPQALMGVASVGLLYLTVKRWFGPAAGLIAGALLAVTPVAVLMFRFNNPDALMTLLLVVAAYGVTRAIDDGRLRWLLVAGVAMGFDFLTKSLQPFTVLPALALVYLVAANTTLGRRIRHLLLAGLAMVVSAGWWMLAVALTPASSRPYIGGSGDNTVWGLAWGYNGLSRLTGDTGAAPGGRRSLTELPGGTGTVGDLPVGGPTGGGTGGPGGGGGFGGSTGLGRMFNSETGTQISWLLPAALLAVVALLVAANRAPRTDRTRAAALLFGGWLVVTAGIFSYASGIIHSYYTVQLAPAIAALVAIGAVVLWRRRAELGARLTLATGIVVTGGWSYVLLNRAPDWHPWLRYAVLAVSLVAALMIALPAGRLGRRGVTVAGLAGLLAIGGGSAAYAANTAATPHNGSVPSAGPSGGGGTGFGGMRSLGADGAGQFPGGPPNGTTGGFPGLGPGSSGSGSSGSGSTGSPSGNATANTALATLLKNTTSRWAAATVGDQSAAALELASGGRAVMAIGGWSDSDATPTLAEFKAHVAAGEIHYFISGSMGGGMGGGNSEITAWVTSTFTATTVGGQTVYDLTAATS